MARYNVYRVGDMKTIVVSRYAGKTIKGIAKRNPTDVHDPEAGEKLARLRCDLKIAEKRVQRSQQAYKAATEALEVAKRRQEKAAQYVRDAAAELANLSAELERYEANM